MEAVLTEIPALLNRVEVDVDRILLSAEWLHHDLVMMEHFLPRPHCMEFVGFISDIVTGVQREADQRKLRGEGEQRLIFRRIS